MGSQSILQAEMETKVYKRGDAVYKRGDADDYKKSTLKSLISTNLKRH